VTSGSEARLESLIPTVRVFGVTGTDAVEVLSVRWVGSVAVQVTYREAGGATGQRTLLRSHEANLRIAGTDDRRPFDADPADWRLAAQALRIRWAALFEPMAAVAASDLQPLPHQLKAVYEELLPRTPLRFLLADDPGAGKTIMCGLYIKELMLRGEATRVLVVAPGSLVEQWQDELYNRFGLPFDLLTREMTDAPGGEAFDRHPLLLARMDFVARDQNLMRRLANVEWDLAVVDEAHRMSARRSGTEVRQTRRYQLGQLLGRTARHLLLMTATPHAGKPDDFELFLALLDRDRFEGRSRASTAAGVDTTGLMRRMVKEELLTMEGRPLFPERRAYTVPYRLSPDEQRLYEDVTTYVRDGMRRADDLADRGDRQRGRTVGFALTILQRRLASSPEAILRSLQRRRDRLTRRRDDLARTWSAPAATALFGNEDPEGLDHRLDDMDVAAREQFEEDVADAATAATTRAELAEEIALLDELVARAHRVRASGQDVKWAQLRSILVDEELVRFPDGRSRKIIIFTEHRDTLRYLVARIGEVLRAPGAVVEIHGGMRRDQRLDAQRRFTDGANTVVLVATDAAGEGVNLQRAHLMVNYDLPWNPNRIEQRFGRIHRIGQTETCHLWNLVAAETREGDVFLRLLEKIEEQRKAYSGQVFDVLGEAFDGQPLRDLLVEAIRDGERPEVRARLRAVIDAAVGAGLDKLIAERALNKQVLDAADIETSSRSLADADRLTAADIESFFRAAFTGFGGRMVAREGGRYEITHVPAEVRTRGRQLGGRTEILARYERVAFDRHTAGGGSPTAPRASLIGPGHPLLDAVVDLVLDRRDEVLRAGTVLVDRADPGTTPRLLVTLRQEILSGRRPPTQLSRRVEVVELRPDGAATRAAPEAWSRYAAPAPAHRAAVRAVVVGPWPGPDAEQVAADWATIYALPVHEAQVRARVTEENARVRKQIVERMTREAAFWDRRAEELETVAASGRAPELRPATARDRARELERRLAARLAELDADSRLEVVPPVIESVALVVPAGLLGPPAADAGVTAARATEAAASGRSGRFRVPGRRT